MTFRSASLLCVALAASSAAHAEWKYTTKVDPMGRGEEKRAALQGTNVLQFQFPYQGGSTGIVAFTLTPKGVLLAYLGISKGQFICLPECKINVRFDDGKPMPWRARLPRDGSHDHIQLFDPLKFIALLKASKRFQAEAVYFQSGRQVTEFAPAGLIFP